MHKRKFLLCMLAAALFLGGCNAATTMTGDLPKTEEVEQAEMPENADAENKDQPKEELNNVYISASKLNVRAEADKASATVGSLLKGTGVEIIEEKTDAENALWYQVRYNPVDPDVRGWILASYTVADRMELLDESLRTLDFSPQPKVDEYPGNPRVEVKGVYVTIHSASGQRLDELIAMAKRTKINAFVIDVKDDYGHMLFKTAAADKYAPDANKKAPVKDISALMKKLKDNNIYAIARIVSFKDPTYTTLHPERAIIYRSTGKPFTNRDGLIWASAYDRELWDYNIAVSKEAAAAGFNEIQYDYVRFPASNGGKLDASLDYRNVNEESKPEAIQNYLKYAHKELSAMNVYISADVYGLVGSVADDMALGQYWEAVSNVVDYISPMMYPSHYANGTYGLSIPDAYPYETLNQGVKDAMIRNTNIETPATIRPWIQDFTASWVKGHIKYGEKEVAAQIKALEDAGAKEFLLWNAGNRYSEGGVQ